MNVYHDYQKKFFAECRGDPRGRPKNINVNTNMAGAM